MTGLGGLFGGLAMVAIIFGLIVLAVLALLMPYYVYCIYGEILKIRKNTDQLLEQAQLTNHKIDQIIHAYQAAPHNS